VGDVNRRHGREFRTFQHRSIRRAGQRSESSQPKPTGVAQGKCARYAEQNPYARTKELVGDRYPRSHEFTIQFRAFDACKSAAATTGIPILIAVSSALVDRSLEGGLVIVDWLNLGGSIEPIYNAVSNITLATDKGAQTNIIPVSTRKQIFELPDELATKITAVYYADAKMLFSRR
jgi:ATP-dependent Lon protease